MATLGMLASRCSRSAIRLIFHRSSPPSVPPQLFPLINRSNKDECARIGLSNDHPMLSGATGLNPKPGLSSWLYHASEAMVDDGQINGPDQYVSEKHFARG